MRIAIDARELRGHPTGVGRYLSQLLEAWNVLPAAAGHEFIMCAPADGAAGGTRWEQLALPRLIAEARADVFFAPGYTGPLRCPVPMVVAIHDVSFAAHPESFRWREGLRRRIRARLSARRAVRVLTISEFSKREIVAHLGIDPGKIKVTYIAAADRRGAPGMARQPRVLYVGSLFNRRHVQELIEGFTRLSRRRERMTLDLVGDNRTSPRIDFDQVVSSSGAADRIRIRSYVTEDELASLYAEASALVFLSEYEGFGLTPLEALAAGVPVVVLDTAVAREIYGDAAVYVPRPDPALVEAALERVVFDQVERARVLDAAPSVLARYSWQACAATTLEVLVSSAAPLDHHRHV